MTRTEHSWFTHLPASFRRRFDAGKRFAEVGSAHMLRANVSPQRHQRRLHAQPLQLSSCHQHRPHFSAALGIARPRNSKAHTRVPVRVRRNALQIHICAKPHPSADFRQHILPPLAVREWDSEEVIEAPWP
eukprot:2623295-Rhodomonas_salina.1